MVTANGDLVICVVKKKGHPLHQFTVAAQKCLLSVNKIREHDARCVLRFILCRRLPYSRRHPSLWMICGAWICGFLEFEFTSVCPYLRTAIALALLKWKELCVRQYKFLSWTKLCCGQCAFVDFKKCVRVVIIIIIICVLTKLKEMFYNGNILRRIIFVNVSKNSDPDDGLRKLQCATRFH